MKKSKVILAIALAIVFIVTCMNVPTFSWFTRPQSQTGEAIELQTKNEYGAYNGSGVTISTTASADGFTYGDTAVTDYSGSGINPRSRNYFCTTITNNSEAEQNVSLYASKLSIPTSKNGTLALGVNGPTRSYRDYSALATQSLKTTGNTMRVYFEKDNNVDGWNGTEFYICWNEDTNTSSESLDSKGSNGTYYKLTWVGDSSHPNQYYADIPKTATHAFFAVANWGTNNNGEPNWGQRSQTLWNLAGDGQSQTTSKLYKITSDYKDDNSNSNHLVHTPPYAVNGACINSYYSSISVAKGNTFNAALSSGEYIGNLEYYSSNDSVFTVNKTTGEITAVGAGEATLYTKAIGPSYKDTVQVETVVKVTGEANYEFNDVPIVRNILIPASGGTEDDPANVVKVYWYVMNNSDSNTLKYTIDSIYLGL